MPKKIDREIFLNAVKKYLGDIKVINRQQVLDVCKKGKVSYPTWLTNDDKLRVGRGEYSLDGFFTPVKSVPVQTVDSTAQMARAGSVRAEMVSTSDISYIPDRAKGYVPFGNFSDIRQIIKSRKFYPIFITGLSGNGKTFSVEQACAQEKRECFRVNITIETDETDLIGGWKLVDGHTVWQDGPVVMAMERGAILLLDEVDLGSNKLMCLQPVLEGKPVYLKKTNKVVTPASGFSVIATANTKGQGNDDGKFIGTNVLNEAFLERFSITMEQEYPPAKTEIRILNNVLESSNLQDEDFTTKLVQWAEAIRKSFYEGASDDIISTRRLVHICEAYAIFGQDRLKAITLCLNRFVADTKTSFIDLYKKIDESVNPKVEAPAEEKKDEPSTNVEDLPF